MRVIRGVGADGITFPLPKGILFSLQGFPCLHPVLPYKELLCKAEMSLNYQIDMQLYVDFCHIVQKVVLVFFFSLLSGASSVFFSTRRYKITCKV